MLSRREMLALAAAPPLRAAARPNILLLMTDQQSNFALSAHGNPYLKTPALDRLAAAGISFTESYCAYPVCSPSRGSIFTSRMPHETGVRINGQAVTPEIPNLGELLGAAGYGTYYGGKWHLYGRGNKQREIRGFTRIAGEQSLGEKMDAPLADACVEFLRSKPAQPFLLVASFMNPHDICSWIRAHEGRRPHERPERFPPPPANLAPDPGEPEYIGGYRKRTTLPPGEPRPWVWLMSDGVRIASQWAVDDVRYYLHSYYRLVEKVDSEIGRVLEALAQSGLEGNTLVIATADHGEGMGAHRWVQKASFHEEPAKVPLILRPPGGRPGTVDHRTLVSGLDIVPTVCDYAGVRLPAECRGGSLRAAVEGRPLDRPFVVSELTDYAEPGRQGRMLRTARYKYIVFNGGARAEQFFDLDNDPGEVYNLARQPAHFGALEHHRALFKEWIGRTNDDFRPL